MTILVNNAGIGSAKKFFDASDEIVDLTFRVNTIAHFWVSWPVYTYSVSITILNSQTIKAFAPSMMAKNKGHIITIASTAGMFGVPGLMDYCASKFGAVGLHESLAAELDTLGANGVKTTLVCPYFIDTGMFDGVKTR